MCQKEQIICQGSGLTKIYVFTIKTHIYQFLEAKTKNGPNTLVLAFSKFGWGRSGYLAAHLPPATCQHLTNCLLFSVILKLFSEHYILISKERCESKIVLI